MHSETKGLLGAIGCAVLIVAVLFATVAGLHEGERTVAGRVVPCVGVTEPRDPTLTYEVSVRNIVAGVIAAETVIVPAYIVLKDFYCPVEG